ncbi:MAG TPA: hypothetical protein ENF41_00690 [Candidatus Bathyarchaeota archaeon]|nr:hypothetical protein [Candidatus Bathyarchaeota archaeon]
MIYDERLVEKMVKSTKKETGPCGSSKYICYREILLEIDEKGHTLVSKYCMEKCLSKIPEDVVPFKIEKQGEKYKLTPKPSPPSTFSENANIFS